jgi:Transposase IS116/IS110/IS902 family
MSIAGTERLQRLEQALQDHVNAWRLHPVVAARQALRGGQCTVAVTMVAAMGALTRFDTPRARMQCLGRIPSEYASGAQRRQGSITQAGTTHARKAVVEGAWAYRSPAKVSRHRHLRREKHPKMIQDLSWQAQVRLCTRSRRLVSRGQHATVVPVAIARELVGCMWAMATQVPLTASVHKRAASTLNAEGFPGASAETQPRCGVTLGGVKRLGEDTRAETEAGTRRRHGRWEPTHGEQQDHPSSLPGSGFSDALRTKKA